jgi:hypothetical protein
MNSGVAARGRRWLRHTSRTAQTGGNRPVTEAGTTYRTASVGPGVLNANCPVQELTFETGRTTTAPAADVAT